MTDTAFYRYSVWCCCWRWWWWRTNKL